MREVINRRKSDREQGTNSKDDLLELLLKDETFCHDDEVIIDELLTIFFAGSQTSANATQNLIFNLCKKPEYKERIIKEI